MNLLLDTNVFIDYLGRKPPFFEAAQRVVVAGFFGDAKLWVPATSLKDAFYVLSRYVDPLRVQQAFLKVCEIVTPVDVTAEDALRAARLEWDDYEDCLVACCADKVRADYLVTRDAAGFARSCVPVTSPGEWLAMMERDHRLSYGVE